MFEQTSGTAPPGNGVYTSPDLYFSEGGFLFDSATGLTYTLNKTGALIFHLLRAGTPKHEITASMMDAFDVDPDSAREDFEDFLLQLRELGLA